MKYYVSDEDLFEVLHAAHIKIGHGGRDRMLYELNTGYKNITSQQIVIFVQCCEVCEKKKSGMKKGVVVKPLVFSQFNSRAQLDLIDLQSQPDRDFHFVFVYQDHLTKFVVLRALTSKRSEEVLSHITDVFSLLGPPSTLQTDNGREFRNKDVDSLQQRWPGLKIVHGKPRHSQSQGSVERCNQDIERMLFSWMTDNETSKWSEGLNFVQFSKNNAYHSGINRTPYEALFGHRARVGLKLNSTSGDELPETAASIQQEPVTDDLPEEVASRQDEPATNEPRRCQSCNRPLFQTPFDDVLRDVCTLCERTRSMKRMRQDAKDSLEMQAKKMKLRSDLNFPDPKVGDTVRVKIPDVDRCKTEARSVLACVLEVTPDNFFKLGTTSGELPQLYTRSQLALCHEKFVKPEDVPAERVSLRSIASSQAVGSGQGFVRCSCTQKCANNRCLCRRKGLLCNSKCHSSSTCTNK